MRFVEVGSGLINKDQIINEHTTVEDMIDDLITKAVNVHDSFRGSVTGVFVSRGVSHTLFIKYDEPSIQYAYDDRKVVVTDLDHRTNKYDIVSSMRHDLRDEIYVREYLVEGGK